MDKPKRELEGRGVGRCHLVDHLSSKIVNLPPFFMLHHSPQLRCSSRVEVVSPPEEKKHFYPLILLFGSYEIIFAMYQKEDVRAHKILVGALNDCLDYCQHLGRGNVKL